MSPLIAIYQVTLRQLTGRKRLIGFSILALVPALILTIGVRAGELDPGDLEEVVAAMLMAPLFSVLIPIIALVIAGSALGDEQSDKTMSFLILRPINRFGIAAAKTLAATTATSIFGIIGAVGLTGTYMLAGGEALLIPGAVIGAIVACAAYSSIFVLFGYMTSRATLLGLFYVFLFENGAVSLLPRLANLSPWRIGFSAMSDLFPAGFEDGAIDFALGGLEPTLAGALLKTVIIMAITVSALGVLLHRRDAV